MEEGGWGYDDDDEEEEEDAKDDDLEKEDDEAKTDIFPQTRPWWGETAHPLLQVISDNLSFCSKLSQFFSTEVASHCSHGKPAGEICSLTTRW